jgi:hypothetical protein
MHRGGEGGCTCILCIPHGYAPATGVPKIVILVAYFDAIVLDCSYEVR